MIPNNNLSVLPWYTSIEQQNARKWWVYGRVYPLFTQAGFVLPFQLMIPHVDGGSVTSVALFNVADGTSSDVTSDMTESGIQYIEFDEYDVILYPGNFPAFTGQMNGRYYLEIVASGITYYSEIYTVVNDIEPYLKIEWWDIDDFVMDAGRIVYKYANGTQFRNVLYLMADIAKPEYIFEEEGETRDGYFFPIKQISEKRYRFAFLASEYLLDVMRFIRMADFAQITKNGQTYSLDTFLISPEWEDNGDVASVEAEFDTATVAKKIGRGYIIPSGGSYNDDYNDSYDNLNN